jgi:hypothetical protein
LGFVGLFIAITIVLALIPVYLPNKDISPTNTAATGEIIFSIRKSIFLCFYIDDDAFYIEYSADTNIDSSVSGKMENLDEVEYIIFENDFYCFSAYFQVGNALKLNGAATITDGDAQATFVRRKRSAYV